MTVPDTDVGSAVVVDVSDVTGLQLAVEVEDVGHHRQLAVAKYKIRFSK